MTEVLINVEQNDLAISTAYTYFVIRNCLNAFDALGANILSEYHDFIFHLEAAEVTALSTCEKEFLCRFAEHQACVVANVCASVDQFGLNLTICGIEGPNVELLGSTHCELIVSCISQFDVLCVATPLDASGCLSVNGGDQVKFRNDETISRVPDIKFAI